MVCTGETTLFHVVFAHIGHAVSGLCADGDRKYLNLYIRINLAQLGYHISKIESHHPQLIFINFGTDSI